jgi:adenosylcobinamide-phosphate guanylyltransferase
MDAVVMCGGQGTRLDTEREKPLVRVDDTPMVEYVLDALAGSPVETVHAVVSPHTPETADAVAALPVSRIDAPGEGYVADIQYALEDIDQPALTVAADLPLLDSEVVGAVLAAHDEGAMTVCVPAALKDLLGASYQHTTEHGDTTVVPAGINVVAPEGESTYCSYDARLAVNVNRLEDAEIAERLV